MKLIDAFKTEKFYTQGATGVPFYGTATGESAFVMKKHLGYGFEYLPQNYKQDYLEIYYPENALKSIWKTVKAKLEQDPRYLEEIKKIYESNLHAGQTLYAEMDRTDLSALSDQALLDLLRRCIDAQTQTAGVGHVIEPVGLGLDDEFKAGLRQVVADQKEFNRACAILTRPSQPSFVYQEQKDLESLRDLEGQALDKALQDHIVKYHYILNTYSGPRELTKEQCLERLQSLGSQDSKIQENVDLNLVLDEKIRILIKHIDFITNWQDERKRYILQGITYLGRIMQQLVKRTGLGIEKLNYLTDREAKKLSSLSEINKLEPALEIRAQGMFFVPAEDGEEFLVGEDYVRCVQTYAKNTRGKSEDECDSIYGTVANTGTAIGPVAICRDLASIDKVKQGDILVASMTRPEYMAAIKKAAAIVTDEGGITCHAAIVARELGIPCIIGTKVATQVFKDGDMVEVRANHGMIRLIAKS